MNKRFQMIIFAWIPVVIILTITVNYPAMELLPKSLIGQAHNHIRWTTSAWARELPDRSELSIIPDEIDLGQLGPGGMRKGSVMLKRAAPGSVDWSLISPAGWSAAHEKILTGVLKGDSELLRFQLKILSNGPEDEQRSDKSRYSGQLLFEAGKDFSAFTRKIEPGHHRELVRLHTGSGPKSFYILFNLLDTAAQPLLGMDPLQIDFGTVIQGENVSRRAKVTNNGWETLKWRASVTRAIGSDTGRALNTGKYVSFLNEEITGSGHYTVARHLKERLELPGKWAENQGYPYAASDGQTLRFHFTGTGIAVYFWRGPATGQLTAFVNDRFVFQQDGLSEQKERFEWQVAEGLSGGSHVLTLVNPTGPVAIEGVRIYGGDIMPLEPGYVTISPDHGAITRQTNYINITVNTRPLPPGHYGGHVLFDSNGGQKEVELSLDVIADNIPRTLDVYRYIRGADYFLTTNPQAESAMLQARGYTKQGIAFRLFSPGMPGTTEFYRWFHPQKGDHFYGYDLKSVKRSMHGYVLEGTIGNIATSRLTHTRDLYRWYNPSSKNYFYSVDPKGEGIEKKGYRYDGIAGYVKP